jgi:hypothetical protein
MNRFGVLQGVLTLKSRFKALTSDTQMSEPSSIDINEIVFTSSGILLNIKPDLNLLIIRLVENTIKRKTIMPYLLY